MYVSRIQIQNFRCFEDITVEFNEGLNVIIGENNSGKTTILKALQLIFNRSIVQKLTIDDFYKGIHLDDAPPEITVIVTLQSTQNELPEDKAVVASWLTKLSSPWQATLTYKYFLPEKDIKRYEEDIKKIKESVKMEKGDLWMILEKHLPKYVYRIYGGNLDSRNKAESEWLEKFDCELLDALRDVESKMFTGKNTILKQVLNYFLDFELKNKNDKIEIEKLEEKFQSDSKTLVGGVCNRLNLNNILDLSEKTGASVGGIPKISGKLEEADILSVLKLMIGKSGLEIPIINNGLGYNNLIYICLILSKLKMITSNEFGENAKIFPLLLVEEPEAHLHPALQYNFLKFLKEEIEKKEISRQIFITTHSTHITAAVNLDSIICMASDNGDVIKVAYPGRVFSALADDIKSKKYIERYLDATKSNMLFSKSVIFVEGIAEQILLPCLAEYIDRSIEKSHVAIVRVDGLTFKHFIKLFGAGIQEDRGKYSLSRKVACIIDTDPTKRTKDKHSARIHPCWPFEIDMDPQKYEYRRISGTILNLEKMTEKSKVEIFYDESGKGKTFEYDLAFENVETNIMFPDSFEIIKDNEELNMAIENSNWSDKEKIRAKKAASYLINVSKLKGENAFDLERNLRENLPIEKRKDFKIPLHITRAILWVCDDLIKSVGNNVSD